MFYLVIIFLISFFFFFETQNYGSVSEKVDGLDPSMYPSWIHVYTRATDSKSTLFLMCARTLNRQRLFNTRILTPAILQASGKASSKAKL